MTTTHVLEAGSLAAVASSTVVALTYTAPDVTAWALLLTAFFTGVTGIITAIRTTRKKVEENTVKVVENTAITLDVKQGLKVVEGHVNSEASRARTENIALTKELASMRSDMADLKQIAALLAQERAMTTAHVPAIQPVAVVTGSPEKHLREIEKNTADTVATLQDDKREILDAVEKDKHT